MLACFRGLPSPVSQLQDGVGAAKAPFVKVTGDTDYAVTSKSDIVIITAGVRQRPGESRVELLRRKERIVHQIVKQVVLVRCVERVRASLTTLPCVVHRDHVHCNLALLQLRWSYYCRVEGEIKRIIRQQLHGEEISRIQCTYMYQ
jgi:hypothetical protein